MNNNYEKAIKNRYEFVILYDVENGNPNGDPDAGNLPRLDPETGHGIVTDVCIKRKIRNYILTRCEDKLADGFDIYVRQNAVLNKQDTHGTDAVERVGGKDKAENSLLFREAMCQKFYDIRAFGAVMTTATKKDVQLYNSAGQVRGPVQLAFGQSVEPVVPREITITRMAVANEKEADKVESEAKSGNSGSGATMGRKAIIPYGLYRQEGYISANLARTVTGFSEDDLEIFWDALINMFEDDRSAARGKMAVRELIVFKHDCPLGNAPAHKLFSRVKVTRKESAVVPRDYSDFVVSISKDCLPDGVEIIRKYRDDE